MLRLAPLSVLVLLACGDDPGPEASDVEVVDAREVAAEDVRPEDVVPEVGLQIPDTGRPLALPDDMGSPCSFGCNLDLCLDLEGCEGPCAWDDRFDQRAAYCTMRCDDGECPPGWTCTRSLDDLDHIPFCASGMAACGNGTREYGEACDDGNRVGGDLCSADCSDATLPETSGRVAIHDDNDGDFTYVIEESLEGGFARLTWDGALAYGPAASEGDYRHNFVLPDFGALSAPGVTAVSYAETSGSCRYFGAGDATLTVLDAAGQRAVGAFEVALACEGRFGSDDCCSEDGVPSSVSVEFDVEWLARPDLLSEAP